MFQSKSFQPRAHIMRLQRSCLPAIAFLLLTAAPALASPVMIRIGYTSCAACHISPQGGGLLTDYGKGMDKAQSLAGGEYIPDPRQQNRRFRHDVRVVAAHTTSTLASGSSTNRLWTELTYRHAFWVTGSSRVTVHTGFEATPVTGISTTPGPRFLVNQALWEYRPRKGLEIAVGRGALPDGLGVSDRDPLFRRGLAARPGGYPVQAKALVWTDRFELAPYVFGPAGRESADRGERGAGVTGGINIGTRAVVGLSARLTRDAYGAAEVVGFYTRLGFGRWGVLSLHEFGEEERDTTGRGRRYAGFAQVFAAPYEWLVTSLILERLRSQAYEETRLRPEVQLRATNTFTLVFGVRNDLTHPADRPRRVYVVQLAVKGLQ
jgi:hypothetical protein